MASEKSNARLRLGVLITSPKKADKAAKICIDKKIPVEARDVPLIAEENGNIVYAIFGVEISEEVKINEKTQTTVYLSVKDKRR